MGFGIGEFLMHISASSARPAPMEIGLGILKFGFGWQCISDHQSPCLDIWILLINQCMKQWSWHNSKAINY